MLKQNAFRGCCINILSGLGIVCQNFRISSLSLLVCPLCTIKSIWIELFIYILGCFHVWILLRFYLGNYDEKYLWCKDFWVWISPRYLTKATRESFISILRQKSQESEKNCSASECPQSDGLEAVVHKSAR